MRTRRTHGGLVALLLVIGFLATLGGAGARWLERQTLHTGIWTDTSARLIGDGDVRRAIAAYGVDDALARAPGVVRSTPGVHASAQATTRAYLASAPGRAAWVTANRDAQTDLLRALDHPRSRDDTVTLDLGPVLAASARRLRLPGGITIPTPANAGRLTILDAGQVRDLRGVVGVVRTLSWALPLGALAAFVLALLVGAGRRGRTLSAIGYCLLVAGAIVLVCRPLLRTPIADAFVSGATDRAGVKAAWTIATSELRDEGIELVIGGAAVTVVSWVVRLLSR